MTKLLPANLDIPMPHGVAVPPRSKFLSRWAFRDRVHIDNDSSIIAVVTGMSFSESGLKVCCNWFSNGDSKEAWFEEWRLSEADS